MDSRGTFFCHGGPATREFRDSLLRPRQYGSIANELRDGERGHRTNQLLRSFRTGDNDAVEFRLNRGAAILTFDGRNKLLRHLGRGFHEHNHKCDDDSDYYHLDDYHDFNNEYEQQYQFVLRNDEYNV